MRLGAIGAMRLASKAPSLIAPARHRGLSSSSLSALCKTAEVVKEPLPPSAGLPSALVGPNGSSRRVKTSSEAAPPCVYVLRHEEAPGVRLAEIQRHDLILHSLATHDGLAAHDAAPLVAHALELLWPSQVRAVAPLPGLPAYVAALDPAAVQAEFAVGDEAERLAASARSALAIARWAQGQGDEAPAKETFDEARPVWGVLAARYAALPDAAEAALYRSAGAQDIGMACFADMTADGFRSAGGACALLAWPLTGAADGGYSPVNVSSLPQKPS